MVGRLGSLTISLLAVISPRAPWSSWAWHTFISFTSLEEVLGFIVVDTFGFAGGVESMVKNDSA